MSRITTLKALVSLDKIQGAVAKEDLWQQAKK